MSCTLDVDDQQTLTIVDLALKRVAGEEVFTDLGLDMRKYRGSGRRGRLSNLRRVLSDSSTEIPVSLQHLLLATDTAQTKSFEETPSTTPITQESASNPTVTTNTPHSSDNMQCVPPASKFTIQSRTLKKPLAK